MSPAQTMLYFRLCGRVRAHYKERGLPWGDVQRHALHQKALGHMKSSKDFTNSDFDRVKAAILAIVEPGNLNAQLHQLDQPELRNVEARQACMALLLELGIGRGEEISRAEWLRGSYLDGIVKRIAGKLNFSELTDRQANHILHTLRMRRVAQQQAAAKHKTPAVVDESVPF
jgi:hypothetical protein